MTLTLEHDYIGIGLSLPDSSSSTEGISSGSSNSTVVSSDSDLKTELRLGLPGSESPPALTLSISVAATTPRGCKRGFSDAIADNSNKWVFPNKHGSDPEPASKNPVEDDDDMKKKKLEANAAPATPAAKAQVVGWPPIRSYRKNTMATNNNVNPSKKKEDTSEAKQGSGCLYVKVSMDGAPYLRKVDLRMCSNYKELSLALEKMFSSFTIGEQRSDTCYIDDKLCEYVH